MKDIVNGLVESASAFSLVQMLPEGYGVFTVLLLGFFGVQCSDFRNVIL